MEQKFCKLKDPLSVIRDYELSTLSGIKSKARSD